MSVEWLPLDQSRDGRGRSNPKTSYSIENILSKAYKSFPL